MKHKGLVSFGDFLDMFVVPTRLNLIPDNWHMPPSWERNLSPCFFLSPPVLASIAGNCDPDFTPWLAVIEIELARNPQINCAYPHKCPSHEPIDGNFWPYRHLPVSLIWRRYRMGEGGGILSATVHVSCRNNLLQATIRVSIPQLLLLYSGNSRI